MPRPAIVLFADTAVYPSIRLSVCAVLLLQIGFKEKLAVVLYSHKREAHRCMREYNSALTDTPFKVR